MAATEERISTTDVCRTCGRTRIEHGTGSPEYMLACVGLDYQTHYRHGFAPAAPRTPPPAVDEFPVRARAAGPVGAEPGTVCARCGARKRPEDRCGTCPLVDMGDVFADPVVAGVGPDAPTTTNAAGGKQSATPYRCDLLPPHAVLAVAAVLSEGAAKYGANNWHRIPVADHLNHAIGHVFAALAGDTSDAHLEHAATRLLFALDQRRSGREGGGA